MSYVTGPDQTAVDNLKKAILAHAAASQSIFRINAMLSKAGDEVGMYAMPDEFDKDKYLLNVLNGTIELKTGTFREHNREDKITKIAPIKYEAGAQCDRFKKFLHEIMGGESALIEYWQRLMGLILTGDISEQYLHICYGTGANGKTTLFETLMALLGPDYAKRASSSLLMEKTFGSEANYDLARFPGVRLVLVRETEEGKRLAEAATKVANGSDGLTARNIYQAPFEFVPEFKLLMATNHKPEIRGTSYGIWRRIRLLPFDVRFSEDKRDKYLPQKLLAESSGILNFAIEGALKFLEDGGLGEPLAIVQATNAYKKDSDTFNDFIEARCERDPGSKVEKSVLYAEYVDYWGDDSPW